MLEEQLCIAVVKIKFKFMPFVSVKCQKNYVCHKICDSAPAAMEVLFCFNTFFGTKDL